MIQGALYGVSAYLALGLLVGAAFMVVGLGRVDPSGKGSSIAVRILLLPGAAVMWPFLVRNWVRGRPPGDA